MNPSIKKNLWIFLFFAFCGTLNAQTKGLYEADKQADILAYRFSLEIFDEKDKIVGSTEIKVRFAEAERSEFALDLVNEKAGKGMKVTSVSEGKHQLIFKHENDRLQLMFSPTSEAGEERTFVVEYEGEPADGLIISKNKFGKRTFFGDNWPDRAHHWLPVTDHPSDKALCEFRLTAPAHYQIISNGLPVESRDLGDGRRLTARATTVPLATKVMVFGAADFAVEKAGEFKGISVESWVFEENKAEGFADYAPAVKILAFFDSLIGPYPYEKLANVQSKTRYGGMENAGNIFYYENSVTGGETDIEDLLAHEIAHQWFGNSASEAGWHHLWLSEGFATYFTQIYLEKKYGAERFQQERESAKKQVLAYRERFPERKVVDYRIRSANDLLNAYAYQKGAWFLHSLRREIGDETFFAGIRAYYKKFTHSNAETADFQKVMEETAGKKLDFVFEQWLFRSELPFLKAEISALKGGSISLKIKQIQDSEKPFQFKVRTDFTDAEGRVLHTALLLSNAKVNEHKLSFVGAEKVKKVILNSDSEVLTGQ